MRVALVVPTFPQLSETFVVSKVLGLVERGMDVHVVCTDSGPDRWAAFGADHPVHALRNRVHTSLLGGSRWRAALTFVGEVVELGRRDLSGLHRSLRPGSLPAVARHLLVDAPLIRLDPDVVHFEFGAQAVGREDVGRRLGCALTVSFRGSDLAYMGLDDAGFYDRLWRSVDGVHVLGQALWARARERGAPADLPHTVIAPAVDLDQVVLTPRHNGMVGVPGRPLRVLSVGRLHWTKAYDDALEAIATLRRLGVQVEHRIVGGGELLEAVPFWRHQLDLDGIVEVLGPLPPSEVSAHYRWADALLHSAISEGFCNVVVEAQAQGLPVVCTDAGGLSENVVHEVTGIVVRRRDPAALAAGLARLALDGALRAAMGVAGRQRVERHFRLEPQLDAWEQFYDDVNSAWNRP